MTSAKHYKLWCHKFNRIIKTFNVRIHKSDNLTKLEQCDVLLSSAWTSDKRGLTPHRSSVLELATKLREDFTIMCWVRHKRT